MVQHRRKWFIGGLVASAILALVVLVDGRGFRRYARLKQELDAVKAQNQQLRQENEVMLREVDALRRDPEALERAAREELGFVKPGEIVINLE